MAILKTSLPPQATTVHVWTHEDAVLQRLDKIIELLEILTSAVPEDDEEGPARYLDGTLME